MAQAHEEVDYLLDIALMLGPEGEDLDLSGEDYTIQDIIEMSNLLGRLRKAGEVVKRSLAQHWHENNAGEAAEYGDQEYYLGYASKKVFQPEQSLAFAEWLKEQDPVLIEKIVGISGIRMTPLGRPGSPIRETFFDEEKTSDDLRIQSRQAR
ncbi:MAG: hypothetical protein DRQ43_10025 [Gammaproteobacteria bacterium]|nr:MAG: hypothetical protein DRQ43_10025 [Gammaproteobacteria bacterium]